MCGGNCMEKCQAWRVYGCRGWIVRLPSQLIASAPVHWGSACLLLARGGKEGAGVHRSSKNCTPPPSQSLSLSLSSLCNAWLWCSTAGYAIFFLAIESNGKYNVTKFSLLPKCIYLTFYVTLKDGGTVWRWHWHSNSPLIPNSTQSSFADEKSLPCSLMLELSLVWR